MASVHVPPGCGDGTPRKYDDFTAFQRLHFRLCRQVTRNRNWASRVYHYVDLNSGPGVVRGMDGSPVLFIQNAIDDRGDWRGYFCERSPKSAIALQGQINGFGELIASKCKIFPTDHREAAERITRSMCAWRQFGKPFGLIYADPNGHIQPEVESIRTILKACPMLDVLVYLSATTIKRCHHSPLLGYPTLQSLLKSIGKQHLLIRAPCTAHQWTFAFLSNGVRPEWKGREFYDSESLAGRAIFDRLQLTSEELKGRGQQELW